MNTRDLTRRAFLASTTLGATAALTRMRDARQHGPGSPGPPIAE